MSRIDNLSNTLIERIASGDRQAFHIFFDDTYVSLYRFVSYFLSSSEEREEVISEVYYMIWARREKLRTIDNLKSYLYIVSRNEAFRRLKENSKYTNVSIDEMPIELSIKSNSAHDELEEKEMLDVYKDAVSQLPERCKLVYLMVREERMKYKEIAEMLSITPGTVEQQMNIAIRKIVNVIREKYPSLPLKPNFYVSRNKN